MSKVNRKPPLTLPPQTHIGPTVRRRRMNRILNENPCIASPAAPANLVMLFETNERMKHDRYRARCSFDSVTTDEDGFDLQVKIDRYIVEFQHAPTSDHLNDDWADEPRRHVVDAVDPEWKDYTSVASTDRITPSKRNHGFRNGDQVQFTGKPAQIGAPLTAGNLYYVVGLNVSDGSFQVAFTQGGAAINLTANGTGQVGFWVPHRYHVLFRGNLQKRKWYRFRVRAVAKGKSKQKSDWTDWEPLHGAQPADTTPPPTPLLVTIWENSKDRVVVDWDDPQDADDSEIVDEDVAFYQVQLSTSPTFASVYRFDRFQVASNRSWRIRNADQGLTFYARVRTVDSSRNKSQWVPARWDPGNSNPAGTAQGVVIGVTFAPQAPNTPSTPNLSYDSNGPQHAKVRALVQNGTSSVDSTHDAAEEYVIQFAHAPDAGSSPSGPYAGVRRQHGRIEGDAAGDDTREVFKSIPKGHRCWARCRAINAGGKSAWTGWVGNSIATASNTVGTPGSVTLASANHLRELLVTWNEPDDDNTTRWKVVIKKAGVAVDSGQFVRTNRFVYRVPKADIVPTLQSFTAEVTAYDAVGNASSVGSSSSQQPVNIVEATELYASYFSSNPLSGGSGPYIEIDSDVTGTSKDKVGFIGGTSSTHITATADGAIIAQPAEKLGFFGGTPVTKRTITGAKGGNAALTDLLQKLSAMGLITDSTT